MALQTHSRELYGIDASPQLLSTMTDTVLEEGCRWQSRPLDALYAIVSLMPFGSRCAMKALKQTHAETMRSNN